MNDPVKRGSDNGLALKKSSCDLQKNPELSIHSCMNMTDGIPEPSLMGMRNKMRSACDACEAFWSAPLCGDARCCASIERLQQNH